MTIKNQQIMERSLNSKQLNVGELGVAKLQSSTQVGVGQQKLDRVFNRFKKAVCDIFGRFLQVPIVLMTKVGIKIIGAMK
jgi:hypothetical protein